MTAEASTSFPEATLTNQLTHETFNDLLYAARLLHFGAKSQEVYGGLKVAAHSDTCTYMEAGHQRLKRLELIIQDIPSEGVLLREIHSYPDPQNDRVIVERALLLNSIEAGPKLLKMPASPKFALADTDSILRQIRTDGEPLSENTAKGWLEGLNGLIDAHAKSSKESGRYPKAAGMIRRLLHKEPEKA